MVMQGQRGEVWGFPLPLGSMMAGCAGLACALSVHHRRGPEWGWGCQRKEEGAGLARSSQPFSSSLELSPALSQDPWRWTHLLLLLSTWDRRSSHLCSSEVCNSEVFSLSQKPRTLHTLSPPQASHEQAGKLL